MPLGQVQTSQPPWIVLSRVTKPVNIQYDSTSPATCCFVPPPRRTKHMGGGGRVETETA